MSQSGVKAPAVPAPKVKVIQLINNVPPVVAFKDLVKDEKNQIVHGGRLVADSEAKLIEMVMADMPAGYYSKTELGKKMAELSQKLRVEGGMDIINWPHDKRATYGILKEPDGAVYAVYRGPKRTLRMGGIPGSRPGGEIATGKSGAVKVVQKISTGEWGAVKIRVVVKAFGGPETKVKQENDEKEVKQEHARLKETKVSHGGIVERRKEYLSQYYFVMEYVRGLTLYDVIAKRGSGLSAIQWLDIGLQATQKVEELHQKGYLHCDIKVENIIYDLFNNIGAVIDLGDALKMDKNGLAEGSLLEKGTGVGGYPAPELRANAKTHPSEIYPTTTYSAATDVYALGMTLKKLYGFEKYNADSYGGGGYSACPFNDQKIIQLLDSMTDKNPKKRPKLVEVIKKLEAFKKQLLPVVPRITGIVRIEDCLPFVGQWEEQGINAEMEALIMALKAMDTVVLAADKDSPGFNKIKHMLEFHGVTVRNEALISENPSELIEEVYELDRKDKTNVIVPYVFYFIPEKRKKTPLEEKLKDTQVIEFADTKTHHKYYKSRALEKYKENTLMSVTEEDLRRIQKILNDEMNRLFKSQITFGGADPRIKDIRKTIEKLEKSYQSKKLTPYKLCDKLNRLQQQLLGNKKPSIISFLSSKNVRVITSLANDARYNVRKTEKELRKPLQIPKMK